MGMKMIGLADDLAVHGTTRKIMTGISLLALAVHKKVEDDSELGFALHAGLILS